MILKGEKMALKIRNLFSEKNDRWEVKVIGEIDIESAQKLEEKMLEIIEENNKSVILNIEEVDYIDSTGLGMFIKMVKRLKEKGNDLYFINPQKNVRKLFKITGLNKVFNIREE